MKRGRVLLFTLLSALSAWSQNVPLSQFRDSLLPKMGVGDLYSIQQSPEKFEVQSVKDSLAVTRIILTADTTSCMLSMPKGVFVGHDYGELGGNLIFTSFTGRTDTVFDRCVQSVFRSYGYIYFTSGIWNQTQHYGQLYLLDTTRGNYDAKLVTSFAYPIREHCVVHDTMYLIAEGKLFRMQYGKPVFIVDVPYSCNSLAVIGRYMYLGLNGGYARLDLKSKKYRYFVYTGK